MTGTVCQSMKALGGKPHFSHAYQTRFGYFLTRLRKSPTSTPRHCYMGISYPRASRTSSVICKCRRGARALT